MGGHRAGVVAGNDDDVLLAFGQFAQGPGIDGVGERLAHKLGLALFRDELVGLGQQYRGQVALFHAQFLVAFAVG